MRFTTNPKSVTIFAVMPMATIFVARTARAVSSRGLSFASNIFVVHNALFSCGWVEDVDSPGCLSRLAVYEGLFTSKRKVSRRFSINSSAGIADK